MQPQNKGPGMLWGQSYVLPMTWGGVEAYGGPLSVDMQPYGCFINCSYPLKNWSKHTGLQLGEIRYLGQNLLIMPVGFFSLINYLFVLMATWT